MFEVQFSKTQAAKLQTDVLVVYLQSMKKQGVLRSLDQAFDGHLMQLAEAEGFEAKAGQHLWVPGLSQIPARRLLLMGLGEQSGNEDADWMKLAAKASRHASKAKAKELSIVLQTPQSSFASQVRGGALGVALARYRFTQYKSKPPKESPLEVLRFVLPPRTAKTQQAKLETSYQKHLAIAQGACLARDLVNEPPSTLNPIEMAKRAKDVALSGKLDLEVLDEKAMKKKGMNLFLAVGRGSAQKPRLIHLTYRPKGRKKKSTPVIALVGKGITFDSGGLSLKPTAHMLNMHIDMAGAAAVLGAMKTVSLLKPSVEVHGYLAAAENMTGADAYRLNDIITAYNKKTVEIHNTDAEGRLVLADTLAYACENGADEVIDLATLTGACLVALGKGTAGLMGNDQDLIDGLLAASRPYAESLWQLPLLEELAESLSSPVADLKNVGGRYGGTITAGLFLREFITPQTKWAHLDIAGPSHTDKDKDHIARGGTGFGVATLVEYILTKQP